MSQSLKPASADAQQKEQTKHNVPMSHSLNQVIDQAQMLSKREKRKCPVPMSPRPALAQISCYGVVDTKIHAEQSAFRATLP